MLSFLPLEEGIQPVFIVLDSFFRGRKLITLPPKTWQHQPLACRTPTHTILEDCAVTRGVSLVGVQVEDYGWYSCEFPCGWKTCWKFKKNSESLWKRDMMSIVLFSFFMYLETIGNVNSLDKCWLSASGWGCVLGAAGDTRNMLRSLFSQSLWSAGEDEMGRWVLWDRGGVYSAAGWEGLGQLLLHSLHTSHVQLVNLTLCPKLFSYPFYFPCSPVALLCQAITYCNSLVSSIILWKHSPVQSHLPPVQNSFMNLRHIRGSPKLLSTLFWPSDGPSFLFRTIFSCTWTAGCSLRPWLVPPTMTLSSDSSVCNSFLLYSSR